MKKIFDSLKSLTKLPWLAEIITALGGGIYLWQAWLYTHAQDSLLDEGLYLLKGYLFATGEYRPFQPYGLWTNHMPLSFLIPGYVQKIFGPGLRTGRHMAFVLASLFIFGIWLVSRRLGRTSHEGGVSRWLGAGAVFVVALNPAVIKIYSIMASQGLAACILVWVLVLTLGKNRPLWQLVLGAALAGLLPLTRLNLLPVLPLVLAYLFWENGWNVGLIATVAGLVPFLVGHALYWPHIMTMWVKWFPPTLTPFMDIWRPEGIGTPTAVVTGTVGTRVTSFFEGFRFHFASLMGAITSWFFWPKKWKKQGNFRIAVFLSSLFVVLFGLHVWASVGGNYCIYCFSNYLAFFSFLGIFLIVVTIANWDWNPQEKQGILAIVHALPINVGRNGISAQNDILPGDLPNRRTQESEKPQILPSDLPNHPTWEREWSRYLAFLIMLVVAVGIGYSFAISAVHGPLGKQMMDFLERQVPAAISVEYAGRPYWDAIAKEYHWSYWDQALAGTRAVLITASILLCVGLLGVTIWLNRSKNLGLSTGSVFSVSLMMFFMLGSVISPTELLGGGRHNYDCQNGVIASYEEAAQQTAKNVEPGDRIYWKGGGAQSILLGLDGINLFPPQLNSSASYHEGGNPDSLTKYGYWNETLKLQWLEEASVLIIMEQGLEDWLADYVTSNDLELLTSTPPIGCREGSNLLIYRRMP